MSQKQKLQDILALDEHIKELETEINASFEAQGDSEEGEGGGNNPEPPDIP
jgi:flagellar motility protein MotE (MotC chaperone)